MSPSQNHAFPLMLSPLCFRAFHQLAGARKKNLETCTAIPGLRFSPSKHACFDLAFRKLIVHNAFPNSLSYHLGQWSGSPWHLLPVKHGRTSPPTPFSGLSALVSPLFPTRGRARLKSPWPMP